MGPMTVLFMKPRFVVSIYCVAYFERASHRRFSSRITEKTSIKSYGKEVACQIYRCADLPRGTDYIETHNFELYSGEFVYFIGRVGSGKSSLLKTMYADLPIYEGEAIVLDFDVRHLKNKEIPNLRRKLGIVFQDFQLLTDRSVYENLAFVLRATGWKDREEIDTRVSEVLDQVGMRKKSYKSLMSYRGVNSSESS